jgi:hypothetical protein
VLLFNHFTRRITVMLTVAENHARNLRLAIDGSRPATAPRTADVTIGEPMHTR